MTFEYIKNLNILRRPKKKFQNKIGKRKTAPYLYLFLYFAGLAGAIGQEISLVSWGQNLYWETLLHAFLSASANCRHFEDSKALLLPRWEDRASSSITPVVSFVLLPLLLTSSPKTLHSAPLPSPPSIPFSAGESHPNQMVISTSPPILSRLEHSLSMLPPEVLKMMTAIGWKPPLGRRTCSI